MDDIVEEIFKLRNSFLIIGLTGRTGAGCSTIAEYLKTDFTEFTCVEPVDVLEEVNEYRVENNESRAYKIVYKYARDTWNPFEVIKASDIIFFFILLQWDKFSDTYQFSPENLSNKMLKNKKIAKELDSFMLSRKSFALRNVEDYRNTDECTKQLLNDVQKYKKFLETDIPKLRVQFEEEWEMIKSSKVVFLYQEAGDSIRKFGSVIPVEAKYNDSKRNNDSTDQSEYIDPSALARKINLVIKMYRDFNEYIGRPTFIVIDALRNPYEVLYFRERYAAFYLLSINTSNDKRIEQLEKAGYTSEDIQKIDAKEYPDKSKELRTAFSSQDIERCVSLSDIFIVNDAEEYEIYLKRQLVRYIALMKHPGLVPPSHQERIMQIACDAQLNSGCISRQVGAAITDEDFSIKAIGWNTVPEGQTPCLLCDLNDLMDGKDASAYSEYELKNAKFRAMLQDIRRLFLAREDDYEKFDLAGMTLSFCFKDIYNALTGKDNQVHTRSLHAEENAFLQLAKYGGQPIKDGKLFTTASCCELCAKKAYQLGIKEIYYIDSYPGISQDHIFRNGINRPKLILFQGVVRRAYERLYTQMLPLKDEIAYLTGVYLKKDIGNSVKVEGKVFDDNKKIEE